MDASITPESEPLLVGDVGGTNVRLAIAQHGKIQHIHIYQANDFPSLQAAIEQYFTDLTIAESDGVSAPERSAIKTGVIDLATPIDQDYVSLTNRPDWAFSVAGLRAALDFDWLHVINDFTALALSIPLLSDEDVHPISPNAHSQATNSGGNIALIGPGTGLGVSGLVETGDGYLPIAGEGGHVTYSGINKRELAITEYLQSRYGHVSAERLLAGCGLVNIYQSICHLDDVAPTLSSPAEISAAAADSDLLAVETSRHYFNILGTVTGNVALTFGAFAGIYLVGGILPRMSQQLIDSGFYQRFLAHGRFHHYLSQMPIYLVTAEQPGLLGCLAVNQLIYRHLGVFVQR